MRLEHVLNLINILAMDRHNTALEQISFFWQYLQFGLPLSRCSATCSCRRRPCPLQRGASPPLVGAVACPTPFPVSSIAPHVSSWEPANNFLAFWQQHTIATRQHQFRAVASAAGGEWLDCVRLCARQSLLAAARCIHHALPAVIIISATCFFPSHLLPTFTISILLSIHCPLRIIISSIFSFDLYISPMIPPFWRVLL